MSGQFFGTHLDSTFSRYSPEFYHFSVLMLIGLSFDTRPNSFSILAWILPFPSTRPDSTIFGYAHRLYPLSILFRPLFRYSHGFLLFRVVGRNVPFFGTHAESTLLRYSSEQFFGTRMDPTLSRYSPGFYHLCVRSQILPHSETPPDTFSILARILPFPDTRANAIICRFSR